ncbi:MAG: hypothetical protein WAK01_10105 [Methylocystis sp.]
MNELSLIELLLGSVSILCVLRLFVVVFLGDSQADPIIGRLFRRLNQTGSDRKASVKG